MVLTPSKAFSSYKLLSASYFAQNKSDVNEYDVIARKKKAALSAHRLRGY